MIHAVLALGLLGLYFPSALSKRTSDSICPVLEAKKDFDKHRFQGQWLTQGTWNFNDLVLECSILNFKFKGENRVVIMSRGSDRTSGEVKWFFRHARIPDSTDPASWEFSAGPRKEWPADYLILDTDYFDYAVVYWCIERSGKRFSKALLLSKTPFPDKRRIDEALESVSRFGLKKTDFVWMDRYEADCYDKLNRGAYMEHHFRGFQMA